MAWLRGAVRTRVEGLLRADVSDPVALQLLRAKVLVWATPPGLLANLGSWASAPTVGDAWFWAHVSISSVLVLTLVLALARGSRLGDGVYLLLLNLSSMTGTVAVMMGQTVGVSAQTTVALMVTTLIGAIFCGRLRDVAALVVVGGVLLWLNAALAGGTPQQVTDAVTVMFALVVLAAIVRFLRDLAFTSLRLARLNEVTDPLTGLANRRGLEREGTSRWAELARQGLPVAALVIDVDHFKRINDTRGHTGGDEVLRELSALLSRTLRTGDIAVRLGGEEFLVLCSVPPGGAMAVAERLRTAVEVELAPITVSIGVHESLPDPQDTLPEAIWAAADRADRALYAAKAAGRNRAVPTEALPH